MKNNKKNIIDIYTDSNVNEILISFDNFKDFLEWNKDNDMLNYSYETMKLN